ncbi:hypothetical protein ACNOYE_20620 [Nannocystaceae bacterium ST9]
MSRSAKVLSALLEVLVLVSTACSGRTADPECEPSCELFEQIPGVGECREGHCSPTFSECFENTEFDTCNAMCEAAGSACAENACAGATYLIHGSLENCLDPTKEGALQEHPCDQPIDWQVNTGAQCCCEQQ